MRDADAKFQQAMAAQREREEAEKHLEVIQARQDLVLRAALAALPGVIAAGHGLLVSPAIALNCGKSFVDEYLQRVSKGQL